MTTQQGRTFPEAPVTPLTAGALIDATGLGGLDRGQVLDVYKEYGAVLIRGLGLDRAGFVAFTESYLDEFMEYVGGANNDRGSAFGQSQTVLTVTGGAVAKLAIPLHGEMFYTEPRPATLFFCCITPAAEDGQTTICDSVALWNALPEDIQAIFRERKLRYRRIYDEAAWTKAYRTDDLNEVRRLCREKGVALTENADGTIETVHVCHAWHETPAGIGFINSVLVWIAREYISKMDDSRLRFEDGEELPIDTVYKIHEISQGLTQNIDWRPGDVAIVDNYRVMHGRRAYEDDGRDIIMRLSLSPLPAAA
ncbi:MAG: TauD/TfdA family dioxygenase [Pseudomonadota bacterium]